MTEAILYAASLPCATQPHAMASMSASGPPSGACEIASTRIPPSYPSLTDTDPVEAIFAGLLLSSGLQHNGLQYMHKQLLI